MADKSNEKYSFNNYFKLDKNGNTISINGFDRTYLLNNKIESKTFYELAKPPLKINNINLINISQQQINSVFNEVFSCVICKQKLTKTSQTRHCGHISCENCYKSLIDLHKTNCEACMQSTKKLSKDKNELLEKVIKLLSPFEKGNVVKEIDNDIEMNEPIIIKEETMYNNSNVIDSNEFIGMKRKRISHLMKEEPTFSVNEYVVPISNAIDEYNKDNMEFIILHKKENNIESAFNENKCAYSILLPKTATLSLVTKYIVHKYQAYSLKDEIVICVLDEDNNSIYVTDPKITLNELRRTYPVKNDIHLSFEFLREF